MCSANYSAVVVSICFAGFGETRRPDDASI